MPHILPHFNECPPLSSHSFPFQESRWLFKRRGGEELVPFITFEWNQLPFSFASSIIVGAEMGKERRRRRRRRRKKKRKRRERKRRRRREKKKRRRERKKTRRRKRRRRRIVSQVTLQHHIGI